MLTLLAASVPSQDAISELTRMTVTVSVVLGAIVVVAVLALLAGRLRRTSGQKPQTPVSVPDGFVTTDVTAMGRRFNEMLADAEASRLSRVWDELTEAAAASERVVEVTWSEEAPRNGGRRRAVTLRFDTGRLVHLPGAHNPRWPLDGLALLSVWEEDDEWVLEFEKTTVLTVAVRPDLP